jgi:hypothetical protein
MIVLLAEVSQQDVSGSTIERLGEKTRQRLVGKVTDPTQETLLERPWVWPEPQQLLIVVGFEHHPVTPPKGVGCFGRDLSDIGCQSPGYSAGLQTKPDWFARIMRNGEGSYAQVTNRYGTTGFQDLERWYALQSRDVPQGARREEDRYTVLRGQGDRSAEVIAVPVRQQDTGYVLTVEPGFSQTSGQGAVTKTEIDENGDTAGRDDCAVAAASAAQYTNPHGGIECINRV